MDEEDMSHTHTHTHTHTQCNILNHKKNEIMPCEATWMDLEMIRLSDANQIKTNTIWYHLYLESKNSAEELMYWVRQKVCSGFPVTSYGKTWTFCPTQYNRETNSQTEKPVVTRREGRGGIHQEWGISRYKLSHLKQVSNQDLLHSTEDYIQYLAITYNGKE